MNLLSSTTCSVFLSDIVIGKTINKLERDFKSDNYYEMKKVMFLNNIVIFSFSFFVIYISYLVFGF